MPRLSDAREKAVETAERLFRSQGYAATGLTQLIAESGSPKGSFYFHFPQGKRQLAQEVLAAYGARTTAGFELLVTRASGDPRKLVAAIVKAVGREMSESGWQSGCVAQVLAQELAPGDGEIADQVSALFERWAEVIGPGLVAASADQAAGREKAWAIIAALEGARTLARVQRSMTAFDAVAGQFGAARP